MHTKTCGATPLQTFIQIHATTQEELRRQARMCKNSKCQKALPKYSEHELPPPPHALLGL